LILVDTGAIVAALHRRDRDHLACRRVLEATREPLATIWSVVSEATYLLAKRRIAQDRLLALLETEAIGLVPLGREDVPRIRELLAKYADLPMDLADAALVRVAEREGIETIFTLDRRDFGVYRPRHRHRFVLVP